MTKKEDIKTKRREEYAKNLQIQKYVIRRSK
jgi:hypothetical protein